MGKGKLLITKQQPDQSKQNIDQSKPIETTKPKHKIQKIKKHFVARLADSPLASYQQQQPEKKPNKKYMIARQADSPMADYQEWKEPEQNFEAPQEEQMDRQQVKLKHLAICFPDSMLEIPQTSALRAYFISEIARISSIFKVDEIVILKDHSYSPKSEKFVPCEYIARNLQYLETPQYLRKHLFKMHPDLNNVGLMNPIEARHHLKTNEICQFREGVALERPTKKGQGSWVDIGLKQQARMNLLVLPLTRVTLRLQNYEDEQAPFYESEAVSKRTPRLQKNLYWGYDVRIANNLKQMIQDNSYDLTFLCNHSHEGYSLPDLEHFDEIDLHDKSILIFFSGMDDLKVYVEKDERAKLTTQQALKLFNFNIKLQNFGVKQLRLEEQLFITLSKLVDYTY